MPLIMGSPWVGGYFADVEFGFGHSARLLAALPVSGDFFVAKNGNNSNPGTEASPKLTIAAGISLLGAGKTLIVKAGVYAEQNLGNAIPNGTSWSDVTTVRANTGDSVIIRPTTHSQGTRCFFLGGSQTLNIKQYILPHLSII